MTNTHEDTHSEVVTDYFSIKSTMNGHQQNSYVKYTNGHVEHIKGHVEHREHNFCDVQHQNGFTEDTDCYVKHRCNTLAQDFSTPERNGYPEGMNGDFEHTNGLTTVENTSYMSVPVSQTEQTDCDERLTQNSDTDEQIGGTLYDLCDRLSSVGMDDFNEQNICQQNPSFHDEIVDEHSVFQWSQNNLFTQDKDGDTCLHIALILKELNLVMALINTALSPRSLSTRNNLSQTPLHLAVLTNQITAVRRLVIGGAEIDSRDRNGNTALHLAIQKGQMDIAATLLEPVRYQETKLNINYEIPYQKIPQNLEIANYEGKTVLHLAAENGFYDIVKLLIEKRADVNSRDGKTGRTILHNACLDGNVDLVKYLLSIKETNINSRSYDDYTPFDFARIRGHTEIAIILAQAGARNMDDDDYSD